MIHFPRPTFLTAWTGQGYAIKTAHVIFLANALILNTMTRTQVYKFLKMTGSVTAMLVAVDFISPKLSQSFVGPDSVILPIRDSPIDPRRKK